MFTIRTVSYTDPAAPAAFARSLRETGFAVLTDHPITPDRIEATYAAWGRFFGSDSKFDYKVNPERQDGYFPFKSENAKDSRVKDLKEFYHVYPDGRVPPELEALTRGLYDDLATIGHTLLGWIQDNTPDDVRARFSEPLPRMLEGSRQNLLRILHYPPLTEAPEPGAVRAAAHGDINLITLLVAGSEPGLEARDTAGNWHAVPCDPGMMAINAGDMLEMASGGHYPSTEHRVINPPAARNVARFSMPMFCHPRPEVVLKPGTTADDFLTQRLREIGLKA
ncbi:isopenicillin N synthase family oxygenase [Limibaculum sp. M0105]|uniref:2-oxoglutarate-dependent ethylene/succinate-forming enzyme n=1 Tax=Thermohalobaculum xanthum TaxID=2753746 RepID=A0A8J7MA48_9RHOB|nr:isopenicillin N synthase family oxygenase [Thermohalobaculum xanthum]MBK0400269.1 isopenicillin N synthase family oxygenase [Thermohalobaculum xanthum]